MKKIHKNEKGFNHIILLICLVLGLAFISALTISRIANNSAITRGYAPNGLYEAKNFGVNFERQSDDKFSAQYSLTVDYGDSFDPKSTCPAQIAGFTGELDVNYISGSEVKIDVLQNSKPQMKDNDRGVAVCPDVVVPAYMKSVTLKKQWIEDNDTNKTLHINKKIYHLTVNKETHVITFSKPNGRFETQPYLPDGLAQLYAYPMYKECMTIDQLKTYAQGHGIVTADSKYPGLTAEIQAIPKLKLEAPDGSNNILLVIADDSVKQLIKNTRNERTIDACHVVASQPVYTGID